MCKGLYSKHSTRLQRSVICVQWKKQAYGNKDTWALCLRAGLCVKRNAVRIQQRYPQDSFWRSHINLTIIQYDLTNLLCKSSFCAEHVRRTHASTETTWYAHHVWPCLRRCSRLTLGLPGSICRSPNSKQTNICHRGRRTRKVKDSPVISWKTNWITLLNTQTATGGRSQLQNTLAIRMSGRSFLTNPEILATCNGYKAYAKKTTPTRRRFVTGSGRNLQAELFPVPHTVRRRDRMVSWPSVINICRKMSIHSIHSFATQTTVFKKQTESSAIMFFYQRTTKAVYHSKLPDLLENFRPPTTVCIWVKLHGGPLNVIALYIINNEHVKKNQIHGLQCYITYTNLLRFSVQKCFIRHLKRRIK